VTRRAWAAPAAGVAALLALHAVVLWPVHGFVVSDAVGYLANARWLAHRAHGTWEGPSSFYHPGWSLLVAPLYVVTSVPRHVQLGAIAINALLAALVLPASYALGRRVFGLGVVTAWAAAVLAATYPAVVLLAGYEWGEALWQVVFVLLIVCAAAPPSRWTSIALAVCAAAIYAIHPRGLGIVAVAAVFLVFRRQWWGLAVLGALFGATRVVNHALLDAIYAAKSASVEGDVFNRLTDVHLLWGAAKATIGQLWYLTVATYGLVPLGALWLGTTRRLSRPVRLFTLFAVLATLAASALEMSDGTRVDHMVYGRYMEGTAPVLLVAGAAALVAWRHLLPRLVGVVVATSVVLALVLVAVRGGARFHGNVAPLNVVGILVWRHSESAVDVARITILTALVTGAVWLLARWRPIVGVGVASLVFVASSAQVQAHTLHPFNDYWSGATSVGDVARELGGPVSYDLAAYDYEAADFYQAKLSDHGVRFFDSRHGERPTTDLVISAPRWPAGQGWGAQLVYTETGPVHHQALWVMPGTQQRRLVAAGDIIPEQTSAPLASEAQEQRVKVSLPATMRRGATRRITAHVTHLGGGAAWLPLDSLPAVVVGTVRLGARWIDASGREVTVENGELQHVVLPGHTEEAVLPLTAPAVPGRYTVEVGLRQEGFAWFPRPTTFTIDVR